MSIVLNLVTPTVSWVMSDGLATSGETKGKISGSLKKFEMLHPKLCIGYTGIYEVAKELVATLYRLYPDIRFATVEKALDYSVAIMKEARLDAEKTAQFLFTGISDGGGLASATLSSTLTTELFVPTEKEYRTVSLCHTTDGNFLESIIAFREKGAPLAQAVKKGMARAINQVALEDSSVNRTTFFQEITL